MTETILSYTVLRCKSCGQTIGLARGDIDAIYDVSFIDDSVSFHHGVDEK